MSNTEHFFNRKKVELGVELNEVQKRAVLQTEGPLLLLASPGSGKTTTIIMRIGYLIEEKGIRPDRIKAVTFSRASASDMTERFKRLFPQLSPVDFSTIHSFAFEVVRAHMRATRTPFQIIEGEINLEEQHTSDAHDPPLHKKVILRRLYRSIVGENMTDEQLDELTTYMSLIKNKMLSPEKWSTIQVDVPEAERILREYETYKQSGYSKLLIDFDDMLTICNQVLERDNGLLQSYQRRYDYILTDESQDTSMVQHAIMDKLVQNHRNLCVVADDDQSLYSWRGAEPAYLLNFQQTYPDAVILFMEQNYRSSKDIVEVANPFIKRNKYRYRFFSHWVVEDILNFMRMTFTDKRPELLEKIHLKFNGYISKQQMAALLAIDNNESVFDNLLKHVPLQDYQVKQLMECKETFRQMKGMPPLHAIRVIRDRLGYEKALEKTCERLGFRKEYLLGILNTLEEIAVGLDTMESFASRLKHLKEVLKTAKSRKGQNVVTFSTMHSSKGLEFERVYMIDLVEGIIPSTDDIGDDDLMEEATRLFYVGMTRAKKVLELMVYRERDGEKATESRFVTAVRSIMNPPKPNETVNIRNRMDRQQPSFEVPFHPDAIRNKAELIEGMTVKHRVFGTGSIVKVNDERVHVRFASYEKALSLVTCLEMGLLTK